MRTVWFDVEGLHGAIDGLLAHRMRSALSALGIVTGVGTIVAALAITSGARAEAVAEIGRLGVDNVLVRATAGAGTGPRLAPVLDVDDASALATRLPGATVATLRVVEDSARFDDRTAPAVVAGVSPPWLTTAGLTVDRGRWLDAGDADRRTAVIGGRMAADLFREADPIGREIEAAGEWRTIVGVLAGAAEPARPAGAVATLDSSRTVFVPPASLDESIGAGDTGQSLEEIVVGVAPGGDVERAASVVMTVLAARHESAARFYEVIVPRELLRTRLDAQRSFHLLLLSIGAVVLVVSGVGVMNIMVASVTERAFEIGVRRAFGATRSAIVRQFATEAGLLGAAAGLTGIPVGLAGAFAAAWVGGWPVAATFTGALLSFGLALVVGLAAAIYPAHLAANLPPIDALNS